MVERVKCTTCDNMILLTTASDYKGICAVCYNKKESDELINSVNKGGSAPKGLGKRNRALKRYRNFLYRNRNELEAHIKLCMQEANKIKGNDSIEFCITDNNPENGFSIGVIGPEVMHAREFDYSISYGYSYDELSGADIEWLWNKAEKLLWEMLADVSWELREELDMTHVVLVRNGIGDAFDMVTGNEIDDSVELPWW